MSLQDTPQVCVQMIAANLSDKDLASFRLSCQHARAAIDAHPEHFWMYRYQATFDKPRVLPKINEWRRNYQILRQRLRSPPLFVLGHSSSERGCLQAVLQLLVDADPSINEYGVPSSKNIALIDHLIQNTNILQCIFLREHGSSSRGGTPTYQPSKGGFKLLQLVQVMLSSRSLTFHNDDPLVWSFEQSQQEVYMDFTSVPLFAGKQGMEANIPWALHAVNFFRNHLLKEEEHTLYDAYRDLNDTMEGINLPQFWKRRLTNDAVPLGKHWKGSYAYLDRKDINKIRKGNNIGNAQYLDHNVDLGEKAIQRLELDFPEDHAEVPWPSVFEKHLDASDWHRKQLERPQARTTRAQGPVSDAATAEQLTSLPFNGSGYDDENFLGAGYINSLPLQHKIPGFKRMTMMKYFVDSNGVLDNDALWAYEGIVLPGDQIIVGRWWSPQRRIDYTKVYSGPFILWNTDCGATQAAEEIKREDDSLLYND